MGSLSVQWVFWAISSDFKPGADTFNQGFLFASAPEGSYAGCVAMDIATPYQTALRVIYLGCLSPGFHWWDGPSGVGSFSEVVP
jgi:hypothetical protein